jgi:hypothetical protein
VSAVRAGRVVVAALLALGTTRAAAQPGLRAGVSVTPDTVAVGDPFVVKVRVQAPAGTVVVFPAPPDTSGPVQARDPRRVDTVASPAGELDVVASYRVSAWDVGSLPLGLADITVRDAGVDRRVPLGTYRVFVKSVLPTDSVLRVPKPARPPLPDAPSILIKWWPWLVAAAIVLALIGWLLSRWWMRRRGRRGVDDPYGRAVRELDRLEKLGLIEAGEHGRLVALAADVVRDYLAARLPEAARSLTSTEVRHALAGRDEVPHERLGALLEFADLVKFAAVRISADAARQAFAEARGVLDDVEKAIKAREERDAAEAAARAKRERDEARHYEDERRRASRKNAA